MRTALIATSVLVLTLQLIGADKDELRARADSASPRECAKVCIQLSENLVEQADREFTAGNVTAGQKTMADAMTYAERATDGSVSSRKDQKSLEIKLRKLQKRVSDVANSLSVEDRPPLKDDLKRFDHMRDRLLESLFGHPKKSLEEKQ